MKALTSWRLILLLLPSLRLKIFKEVSMKQFHENLRHNISENNPTLPHPHTKIHGLGAPETRILVVCRCWALYTNYDARGYTIQADTTTRRDKEGVLFMHNNRVAGARRLHGLVPRNRFRDLILQKFSRSSHGTASLLLSEESPPPKGIGPGFKPRTCIS